VTDKLEKLDNFLRGNVISPSTPKSIFLSDFEFNFKDFRGSFKLKLDSDEMKERFQFGVEIDGKYEIYPPIYISPMGVPGSYPKIELTEETTDRINKLINQNFPRVKPLGLDQSSSVMIDRDTPMKDRVFDVEDVMWKMNLILDRKFELKDTL
jgi:hypothetical protein